MVLLLTHVYYSVITYASTNYELFVHLRFIPYNVLCVHYLFFCIVSCVYLCITHVFMLHVSSLRLSYLSMYTYLLIDVFIYLLIIRHYICMCYSSVYHVWSSTIYLSCIILPCMIYSSLLIIHYLFRNHVLLDLLCIIYLFFICYFIIDYVFYYVLYTNDLLFTFYS